MDRLEAFEQMLADIQKQSAQEKEEMDRLKAEGREKTATYRQYFANRQVYRILLDRYRHYGLID